MNKKELIEKVTPLFLQSGYKSLKMDDIAEELSMSKKTIYKTFPTKLDLFQRVVENIYPHFEGFLERYEKDSENVVDYFYRLKQAVEQVIDIHQQREFFLQIEKSDSELSKRTIAMTKQAVYKFAEHTTKKSMEAGIQSEFYTAEEINILFANNYWNIKLFFDYDSKEQFEKIEKKWFYNHLRGTFNAKGCEMLDAYVRAHPEVIG